MKGPFKTLTKLSRYKGIEKLVPCYDMIYISVCKLNVYDELIVFGGCATVT